MEDPPRAPAHNPFFRFVHAVQNTIDRPVTWFRESVVTPNRPDHVYYHQKFRRVPTIDQCYTDDPVCRFEAQQQFNRDKLVDGEIVQLVRQRLKECIAYEIPDQDRKCAKLKEEFDKVSESFCMKYADLGPYNNVKDAYMKQKHRMLWERRHGKVGTGMKIEE
ncbi:NADH dehydrogenase [ubiquinone] 1 beta subcomplex subunit 10-like [Daphnia pulex]|uniref:NADH dehydrogenase [ubiquinone] 1 beta subcomplex subunit 10-like n=1 Tax=Daphnia pulex TaxID=6669 RepID=UPI001EE0B68C|nr:NADH dehydrogenase [ubiquinone] 1 beta subcomplex subunit 10-like [Daphnia pulex]XP_046650429.1 NADH dehydrogenase [ubiquinone] 1 beta subcomplex subunit 10-like [Daphnia pulicaria]